MDVRPTTRSDLPAVDALLSRSYPVLLKADYPASVLVTALPLISKAQPHLIACGTYYGVFEGTTLLGAGGWTRQAPGGAGRSDTVAHVRHVVSDPDRLREGVGRRLMTHVMAEAKASGMRVLLCQSTRTAVPFYAAMGFQRLNEIAVPLRAGVTFPAVQMKREL